MKTPTINACILLVLISLASFRPWKTINKAFGLRDLTDSISVAPDTMAMTQNVQVVIPPMVIDSLHEVLAGKKQQQQTVLDSIADIDEQAVALNKKLASKKKTNQKKQAELMSQEEIDQMIQEQTKTAKSGKKTKPFDPNEESALEKEVNGSTKPGPPPK